MYGVCTHIFMYIYMYICIYVYVCGLYRNSHIEKYVEAPAASGSLQESGADTSSPK